MTKNDKTTVCKTIHRKRYTNLTKAYVIPKARVRRTNIKKTISIDAPVKTIR